MDLERLWTQVISFMAGAIATVIIKKILSRKIDKVQMDNIVSETFERVVKQQNSIIERQDKKIGELEDKVKGITRPNGR